MNAVLQMEVVILTPVASTQLGLTCVYVKKDSIIMVLCVLVCIQIYLSPVHGICKISFYAHPLVHAFVG